MPRYFFQVSKYRAGNAPEEPLEFADIDAAWEEATLTAGDALRDMDGSFKTGMDWSIEIHNDKREKLRSLTISAREWKSE